jgi:phosphomannomutase/phosphoglucomutase
MTLTAREEKSGTTDLNPRIFREFSIRGIADQDLTDEVVRRIGQAVGTFFLQRDGQMLVVGRDVRISSPRISRSLIGGLLQAGLQVIEVGVVPTPLHNFATDFYRADGGVMVTASHNPPEHNGLKIRTDRTLRADELHGIYRLAAEQYPQASASPSFNPKALKQVDPLPVYVERIKTYASIQTPRKVVVDGGNGTNGLIVSKLLQDMGCEVIQLYCEPDGSFPNRDPDPTAPGATSALAALVRAERADLGLAYDGDGDRLAVVDERGTPVLGDQMLMLLARDVLRRGPAKIVYEILCTQALADDVIAHGGEPVMTPSGYPFVHQAMRDTGAALGGEFSGHLFFNTPDFGFDDSILASIRLLNIVSNGRPPLSALVAELPAYHSSPQIRLACPDGIKTEVVQQVKNYFKTTYPVDELDGARINFGDGWALVRASNTQPALSLRFEATSKERLEQLKDQVLSRVEHWVTRLGEGVEPKHISA